MQTGNQGFAVGEGLNMAQLQDLYKALEATAMTGGQSVNLQTASGAALKVEDLDSTLKVLTATMETFRFYKVIPQGTAKSNITEFNQLISYGSNSSGFFNEGDLPSLDDSVYVRKQIPVKYIGTTRRVTHVMTLVDIAAATSAMELEQKNGTLRVLETLSVNLTRGDSTIIPQSFDGFYTQHRRNEVHPLLNIYVNSPQVIDARGTTITESIIMQAQTNIVNENGVGTHLLSDIKTLGDFGTTFLGNKLFLPNTAAVTDGIVGQKITGVVTQYGAIELVPDLFTRPLPSKLLTNPATSALAPTAPTVTGAAVVGVDAFSKFFASDAGTYFYAVSALNYNGESALTLINAAAVAAVAGGSIDLTFAPVAGPNVTTGFRIYRSDKNAAASTGNFYPIFEVGTLERLQGYDGALAGVVRDRNYFLTNTTKAWLFQNDSTVLEYKKLLPLTKWTLPSQDTSYRFSLLLYGTPLLYAPKKAVLITNIKYL